MHLQQRKAKNRSDITSTAVHHGVDSNKAPIENRRNQRNQRNQKSGSISGGKSCCFHRKTSVFVVCATFLCIVCSTFCMLYVSDLGELMGMEDEEGVIPPFQSNDDTIPKSAPVPVNNDNNTNIIPNEIPNDYNNNTNSNDQNAVQEQQLQKMRSLPPSLSDNNHEDRPKIKIVAFSDSTYWDLALDWYNSLAALGYDNHYIIAMDDETYQAGLSLSSKYKNDTFTSTSTASTMRIEPYYTEKESLRSLWYKRIEYLKNQIMNGTSILLTDVDNTFQKYIDIEQYMYHTNYDIIFAHEMKFPEWLYQQYGFITCAGFIWFKAYTTTNNNSSGESSPSLKFLDLWLNSCVGTNGVMKCNDQVELNKVLHQKMNITWEYEVENQNTGMAAMTKKHIHYHQNQQQENEGRMGDEFIRIQSNDANDGLIKAGMIGTANTITSLAKIDHQHPFNVKVLNRDIAWRGRIPTEMCPSLEHNWVAMPTALPFEYGKGKSKIYQKKLTMLIWDKYCGVNGTNWDESIKDPLDVAFQEVTKEMLKK